MFAHVQPEQVRQYLEAHNQLFRLNQKVEEWLNDLPEEYCEELVEAIRYLKKYPIPGRWRDKFLGWCILHHIEGPCKRYALHKIEKTKKLNNKSKMKS